MIDLAIRVRNPNVWEVKAKDLGFMKEVITVPAVIDPETGEETSPAQTEWVFKDKTDGVHIVPVPTIWITPPDYYADGSLASAGVKAPGQHFNIRISNPAEEEAWANLWEDTYDEEGNLVSRAIPGAQAANPNKTESAWRWQGIEIIDMTTVRTPQRVWL